MSNRGDEHKAVPPPPLFSFFSFSFFPSPLFSHYTGQGFVNGGEETNTPVVLF